MTRVPTFAQWERAADGERVELSSGCECSGRDEEHERWCPVYRRQAQTAADHIFHFRSGRVAR